MAKKSDKRQQTQPFQIRMTPEERAYIEKGAAALSARSPVPVALGPFMKWAAMQETAKLMNTVEEVPRDEKRGGRKS